MTRYTNVARKRTFVQAGFNYRESEDGEAAEPSAVPTEFASVPPPADESGSSGGAKKKRKRGPRKQVGSGAGDVERVEHTEGVDAQAARDGEEQLEKTSQRVEELEDGHKKRGNTKAEKGKKKLKERRFKGKDDRKAASEQRRLKRQDQRHADTVCFACRELGHAARDCPKAISTPTDVDTGSRRTAHKTGKQVVGICYRCGSRKHNLSRCPKPIDSENPLPFSSCFVCGGKGHLASSCPQNKAKGVYPNGGCCKLCGETTHLAKNCDLRKPEIASTKLLLGTGDQAGADEDDFHTFKRQNATVSREEKQEERRRKQKNIKVGALSGKIKAFGTAPQKPKKVVNF